MIDIEQCYQRGLAALTESRTDSDPHIGTHLAGACDRESWAKRRDAQNAQNGASAGAGALCTPVVDPNTLTGFWLGHTVEHGLLSRIEAGLPYGFEMDRSVKVVWKGLTGNIDAIIFDADRKPVLVIDTKSTVWWNRTEMGRQVWYPKDVKHGQVLQVAAYAIAIECPAAGLFELDLGGKARQWIPVNPEEYREEIERRVREVIERTDPAGPEPDVTPNEGFSWMCGSITVNKKGETVVRKAYCSYTGCPHHVSNKALVAVP